MPEPEPRTIGPVNTARGPDKKPRKPRGPAPAKTLTDQLSAFATKRGHRGFVMLTVKSMNAMRCYVVQRKDDPRRLTYPPSLIWPNMDDHEGAMRMIDAVVDKDLPVLAAMRGGYPGHEFGFESMLDGHDRNQDPTQCIVVKSIPLPREHRLDFDLIETMAGAVQIRAAVRRGNKTIITEVVYDSETDESGTDDAAEAVTVSDQQGETHE